jgi:hypothetical protein
VVTGFEGRFRYGVVRPGRWPVKAGRDIVDEPQAGVVPAEIDIDGSNDTDVTLTISDE